MVYMSNISRQYALDLLHKYNKEDFHLRHAYILEKVMIYFADELGFGDERDFWGLAGLLHDLDYEMFPDEHCIKQQEILRENGFDERFIRAVCSHGYGFTTDIKPEHTMEKVLYATDELTGLIGAAALVRPSKSVSDIEIKSVKKKFKTPSFAAGCSREIIQKGADMLGWELDYLIDMTIKAMRTVEGL
jgi:predicted hydrolase (HD superfamily)